MGELGFNKIFGAALATFLFIFGLNEVSARIFGEGGHHGDHHYESQNEWAAANFKGYIIPIAEASTGEQAPEGPVFDLGLMLASADPAAGEAVMNSQCKTCHSWNQGGANGTGPNLYGVIGRDIASASGFNYSGALTGIEGAWTYEQMNAWLTNPGSFARGTSMAYAGLRSPRRDADRVNLIAYLASTDTNAPAFPAPLATEASVAGDEDTAQASDVTEVPESVTESVTDGAPEGATEQAIEAVTAVDETGSALIPDAAREAATSLTSDIQEAVEAAAEDAVEQTTDGQH